MLACVTINYVDQWLWENIFERRRKCQLSAFKFDAECVDDIVRVPESDDMNQYVGVAPVCFRCCRASSENRVI